MDVKISIKGATAEQVAQIFANIHSLDSGSEMVVAGKTKDLNLTPRKGKGPVKTEDVADDAELEAQDKQEDESPAPETAAPAKDEKKTTTRSRSRQTKDQVEEANKNKPAERPARRGSDDDDTEEEKDEPRRSTSNAGTMLETMVELSDKFVALYETNEGGKNALKKRLKPFGVSEISEVAPADRSAVILMLKDELAKPE